MFRYLEAAVNSDMSKMDELAADQSFALSCSREMALLALMERTGYSMVQENGQRKYGGPPPGGISDHTPTAAATGID